MPDFTEQLKKPPEQRDMGIGQIGGSGGMMLHCGPASGPAVVPSTWTTQTYPSFPMRYPHRCPVCSGTTQVTAGYYKDDPNRTNCRGCMTTGVVWG